MKRLKISPNLYRNLVYTAIRLAHEIQIRNVDKRVDLFYANETIPRKKFSRDFELRASYFND